MLSQGRRRSSCSGRPTRSIRRSRSTRSTCTCSMGSDRRIIATTRAKSVRAMPAPLASLWLSGRWFQLESGGCWGRLDHAMVKLLDDAVENVTSAMRAESMWDQTLFVMCESPDPSSFLACSARQQCLTDERAQRCSIDGTVCAQARTTAVRLRAARGSDPCGF